MANPIGRVYLINHRAEGDSLLIAHYEVETGQYVAGGMLVRVRTLGRVKGESVEIKRLTAEETLWLLDNGSWEAKGWSPLTLLHFLEGQFPIPAKKGG